MRQDTSATPLMAAILAAGLGRRLEPLTRNLLPKPLFPIGPGVPICELWVRRLSNAGIDALSMNVCVLATAIRHHFSQIAGIGPRIRFVEEPVPSGTLGGVCKQVFGRDAKRLPEDARSSEIDRIAPFRGSTVLVPSGDIVTDFDEELLEEILHIHRSRGAAFSLVLTPIPPERRKDFGTVLIPKPEKRSGPLSLCGRVSEFIEKDPNSPSVLNNASIYLIERELLEELDALRTPTNASEAPFYDFGKHVFPALLGKLPYADLARSDAPVWGIQYDGAWFDVGNKRDYLTVNRTALDGGLDLPSEQRTMPWGSLGSDVEIDLSGVEIRGPVSIGNGCRIEPGCVLGPHAVIGDGWTVQRGARISDSVLWRPYPFYTSDGREIPAEARAGMDPHRVGPVTIHQSIVTGGQIDRDVIEKTVQVLEDGELEVLSIDWVPPGPRA